LGTTEALRHRTSGPGGVSALPDPRTRTAGCERTRSERQVGRRLVGLEPGQGNHGMVVLVGPGHNGEPPQLRAALRSGGARVASVDSVVTRAFDTRGAT